MPRIFEKDHEVSRQYHDGKKNTAIRFYFYAQRGLMLLNEFRYLVMAIFALYYTLRLDNPILLFVMFFVSLPVLIFLGYINVHHMAKVMEYLNIRFATVWSRYGFTLHEDRNNILKEIKDLLQKTHQSERVESKVMEKKDNMS